MCTSLVTKPFQGLNKGGGGGALTAPPEAPGEGASEVQAAGDAQAAKAKARRGRQSTILTSPLADSTAPQQNISRPTLLGG